MNIENKTLGCGIEFPYFGANYPDAVCIDGYLWDMDSGDEEGLTIGGDDPCPVCNREEWLKWVMENEDFETREDAIAYANSIRDKYLEKEEQQ